jgi:hypothetical protein
MTRCSKLYVLLYSILLVKATDVDIKQSYLSICAISEECPTFEEISILKLAMASIDHQKNEIHAVFNNVTPLALHFSMEGGVLFIDLHGHVRIHDCACKSMYNDSPEWTFPFHTWGYILDLNNPVNTSMKKKKNSPSSFLSPHGQLLPP